MTETGTVIRVGDGIARVYGIRNCMANELLEFEDGSVGMAQKTRPCPLPCLQTKTIFAKARRSKEQAEFFPFPSAKECSAEL